MRAVGGNAMFVRDVVIVAHDAMMLQSVVEKEMIFVARHAVVHQIFVHFGLDPAAVIEVERKKTAVRSVSRPGSIAFGIFSVKIFRRFALNKYRVRPHLQYCLHRQHVGFYDVF